MRIESIMQVPITEFRKLVNMNSNTIPVPIVRIASEMGIRVMTASLPDQISGFIRKSKDKNGETVTIVVNENHSNTRKRFTIAHEIAHFILHYDKIGDGIVDREAENGIMFRSNTISNQDEYAANGLAAEILMPVNHLNRVFKENPNIDVDELARRFNVSESAMKIRLQQIR